MVKDLHKTSATLSLKELQQDIVQENSTIQEESWPMSNLQKSQKSEPKYKWKIVWRNVIIFLYFHIGAIYGAYLFFTVVRWYTIIFCKFFNFDFPLLSCFAKQSVIDHFTIIKIINSRSIVSRNHSFINKYDKFKLC